MYAHPECTTRRGGDWDEWRGSQDRTLIATAVPFEYREEQRRYELKGTYSINPRHRFQVNYNNHDRSQVNHTFNQNASMDLRSLGTRRMPEGLYAATYSGMLTRKLPDVKRQTSDVRHQTSEIRPRNRSTCRRARSPT